VGTYSRGGRPLALRAATRAGSTRRGRCAIGKKTTKTSSTSTPWAPAQPILTGAGNAILDNYNSNQGNLQSLSNSLTSSVIPGIQQQIGQTNQQLQPGYNYIGSTLANNPGLANPANAQLSAYGNGGYLNENNAAVQQLAQFAGQQAGNSINSAFSSAGRTGSGNHATDLARGVTQASLAPLLQNNQFEQGLQQQALGMLGQNYNAGMGAQANAAGLLPNYGASQYAGYTPLLGAAQLAGQLPYYGANSLGNIGSLYGGYGTQAGTQPGGWMNGLLSAGASLGSAAIMASDRRLKTKITKIGEAKDGLGIYEWNWKADPNGERVRGVIADEVEKLRPQAFVKGFVGGVYDGVNYAALGGM
jgi:hypothetical protein